MTYDLIIRSDAEAEIVGAYQWYESQVKGLGRDLLICLDATMSAIQRNPLLCPVVHKEIRRALVRRFPYEVFYLLQDRKIVVLAVFHARRDPKKWKNR